MAVHRATADRKEQLHSRYTIKGWEMARSSMYPGPAVSLHCRRPQWIDGVRVKVGGQGEEARAGQGLDFEPPVFGGEEQKRAQNEPLLVGGQP